MPPEVPYALTLLATYLAASIPFGLVLGRLVKGVDIRTAGSGNIGATNAARVLGWGWFPVVMLLDAAKGFVPVFWLAPWVAARWPCPVCPAEEVLLPTVTGLVAILGHVFPLYLKLRGGRGVATGAGVVCALDWRVAAIAVGVWAVALPAGRYASVAAVLGALTVPVAAIALDPQAWDRRLPVTILFLLAPVIVTLRHIPNFKRLAAGTEDRLWSKKST